jgi:hypothetical protein
MENDNDDDDHDDDDDNNNNIRGRAVTSRQRGGLFPGGRTV